MVLLLALLSGCGTRGPGPEELDRLMLEKTIEALAENRARFPGGLNLLLPVPEPEAGRPAAVSEQQLAWLTAACSQHGLTLEVRRFPGPGLYDEAEHWYPDSLQSEFKPGQVVLSLLPPPEWAWKGANKWVIVSAFELSARAHWPEGFPALLVLPRESPAEQGATFDRFFTLAWGGATGGE